MASLVILFALDAAHGPKFSDVPEPISAWVKCLASWGEWIISWESSLL